MSIRHIFLNRVRSDFLMALWTLMIYRNFTLTELNLWATTTPTRRPPYPRPPHGLRALAQFGQKEDNNRIPWGNTKEEDWARDGQEVTFHFTSGRYREGFLREVQRLLPSDLWTEVRRSDANPARPAAARAGRRR